jgi:hypothetical protein
MNIFFLSRKTRQCARWHCDKHVVKMILESTQLLYTAHHEHGGTHMIQVSAPVCASTGNRGYRSTHKNHPSALWTRASLAHYYWLISLAKDLVLEHEFRFAPKKPHACLEHLEWLEQNPPPDLEETRWIRDPTPAMPDEYKSEDVLESYRKYYSVAKKDLLKYTKRHLPHIFK